MGNHISVDFETFFSTKLKYGLKQLIAETYVRHELFDCYLISVCNGTKTWVGHPKDFIWQSLHGQVLVSHNRYFDNTVFQEMQRRGLIPETVVPAEWHCTANLTAYLCNRRALKDAVAQLYNVKVSKDYRDIMDGARFEELTEAQKAQVCESGRVDAQWCWKLWEDYGAKWPAEEKILSNLTIDQGMFGVQIDTKLLDTYIIATHAAKQATEAVIPWLRDDETEDWDEFRPKPTSTKCIAEQCRRKGIPCPPTKSDDEEGYEEWELTYGVAHPWIKAVGAWRSINKLYCTFLTVKQRVRSDGTMPFALKYFGAHTGRWSGDAKINFQNMRKKPLFVNEAGLMETDEKRISAAMNAHDESGAWPDWVKHALDFRALIIARPGMKLVSCDLAQIEPRVLAHLGGNKPLLKLISEGYGVYEAFGVSSMDYKGPRFTSAIKKTDFYKMLKIQVLGLGYGAGWEKFIAIALGEGGIDLTVDDPEFIDISDPFVEGKVKRIKGWGLKSREIVKNFRDKNPHITGVWRRLDDQFRRSVGEKFVLTLPSGRKMTYHDVKCATVITPDPETGRPKRESRYTAEVGGRRHQYYGGKLTENAVQATARDVFGHHVVALHLRGWRVLFTVHDEAVLELPLDISAQAVEQVMSQCPSWLAGCPIGAEAKEIAHYEK